MTVDPFNASSPPTPSPDPRPPRDTPPRDGGRRHLRQTDPLLLLTIAALLVMSLGVNLFIFKQMRGARAQLAAVRANVRTLSNEYQVKEPAMRRFVGALQAFAAGQPDFQPVLQRYRLGLSHFFVEPALPPPAAKGAGRK
jgi:hypothetical protein